MIQNSPKPESLSIKENWDSGIDLLRCIGLLFVVSVHFFLYNGYYNEKQIGFSVWTANFFRWIFFGCNGLFLTITGYLLSQKTTNLKYFKRIIPILISYALTCLISYPIRHFVLNEKLSLWEWIYNFISFSNYSWYIEMYIGLILFSPILNLALKELKTTSSMIMITFLMLMLTSFPTITPLNFLPDYWISLFPFTFYLLGGIIRKLQLSIKKKKLILLIVFTASIQASISLLSTDETFSSSIKYGYGNFFSTIIIISIFLLFYKIELPKKISVFLRWIAPGCFEGYILSRLFDVWAYDLYPEWHTPSKYLFLYISVSIPIFVISLFLGKLVHTLSLYFLKLIHLK